MNKIKIAPSYSSEYLEIDRPSPLVDVHIENLIQDVLNGKLDKDISDKVYTDFKEEASRWILSSKLNKLSGFEVFSRLDIINGCTQYIDSLYIDGPIQIISGDYRYHDRLGRYYHKCTVGNLIPKIPLIIAMPFPSIGSQHDSMDEILDECLYKDVPVHIDGAWITCCKDINFEFNHPAIHSVGISLSKGLGLGWNRIGLRWTRELKQDSITIMNDFNMNNRALAMIGLHFVRNFPSDYLWQTHGDRYYKICKDFNLTPTKSIYLALQDNKPVGVSPLMRYLENGN